MNVRKIEKVENLTVNLDMDGGSGVFPEAMPTQGQILSNTQVPLMFEPYI